MEKNNIMNSASELTKSALRQDLDLWRLPGQELHDVLDVLRRQALVVPVTFLGMPCWLITDHETLVTAFRDNDDFPPHTPYKFGIEPVIGETFQTMESDRHGFFRKLATPTFMPRSVDRIDSTMLVDVADELIDTFIKKNEVDLVSAFTRRYPFTVIARLLGIRREEEEQFHHWATTILSFRSNPKESFKSRDEFWA
jgi:cytochrome P450